jgi:hypothetical protein
MAFRTNMATAILTAMTLVAIPARLAWSQPAGPDAGPVDPSVPAPPDPGPRGDRGGPDARGPGARGPGGPDSRPNQLAAIHEALGNSDEEFAVLEPKIVAVLDDLAVAQSAAETLYARGPRGPRRGPRDDPAGRDGPPDRRGPAGPDADPAAATPNTVQQALADLQATLVEPDVTPDAIKAKVDAYHDAVIKAREKLARDRADLQSVLTQEQEARMILLGILG